MTKPSDLSIDTSESWITPAAKSDDTSRVWRYMNFGRFVWMLQRKQLWLSRIDTLGDPWELSLSGEQLAHVVARHPITPVDELRRTGPQETAVERSLRIILAWRRSTFVSCWTEEQHESHALWRVYCHSREGVAIRTTLSRLRASVADIPVHRVTYREAGSLRQTPGLTQLATEKRPMFAYEHEVRVVFKARQVLDDPDDESLEKPGFGIEWDPETVLDGVFVHPDGDVSFMETVVGVVERYAPALARQITWSAMQARPPF